MSYVQIAQNNNFEEIVNSANRMLVILRDQKVPLPAGAILISPWVDLMHSFPSCASDNKEDYLPSYGFMQRPSMAWPPPNADEFGVITGTAEKILNALNSPPVMDSTTSLEEHAIKDFFVRQARATAQSAHLEQFSMHHGPGLETHHDPHMLGQFLRVQMDGNIVEIKDQIHMYATNQLLSHPLVSPVLQPSLGGLPPLLILTGGSEMLRDEQIYLAHKAANPTSYPPSDKYLDRNDPQRETLSRYKPTYVQLQVWDGLCHVAPTLSFTRPAKHMFRAIAQFGAWALSRAQVSSIDIPDVSPMYSSESNTDSRPEHRRKRRMTDQKFAPVGKAGDPLPPFRHHMIRQRVDRHGNIYPLEVESRLPALQLPPSEIGEPKTPPVRHWLTAKQEWDTRFARQKRKVQKRRIEELPLGIDELEPGERPPPSSLVARRGTSVRKVRRPEKKNRALSIWNSLGSSHDTKTIKRESKEVGGPETSLFRRPGYRGSQTPVLSQHASHTRVVTDIGQSNGSQIEVEPKLGSTDESDVSPAYHAPALYDEKGVDRYLEDKRSSSTFTIDPLDRNNSKGFVRRPPHEQDQDQDEASTRALHHSEGIIPAPLSPSSSHPAWRTPRESASYDPRRKTGERRGPPVHHPFERKEQDLQTLRKKANTDTRLTNSNAGDLLGPTGTVKRSRKGTPKGKETMYDFESVDRSPSETEPFPPFPMNGSGEVSESHSGYSSHYS